jgi:phosphatidylinositol 4-kinase
MIDSKGHLIHIDFGFMLQNSPGGISFEGAPFKLTQEYVELMDGVESEMY